MSSKQKIAVVTLLVRRVEKLDSSEYIGCKQLHFSYAAHVWVVADLQP